MCWQCMCTCFGWFYKELANYKSKPLKIVTPIYKIGKYAVCLFIYLLCLVRRDRHPVFFSDFFEHSLRLGSRTRSSDFTAIVTYAVEIYQLSENWENIFFSIFFLLINTGFCGKWSDQWYLQANLYKQPREHIGVHYEMSTTKIVNTVQPFDLK